MKSIKDLKAEITEIKNRITNEDDMTKAVENRLRKRILLLKTCILYMETNPDKDFIAAQIKMVEGKINLRMKGFNEDDYKDWSKKDASKAKRSYEKEYEIPKLRQQVSAMRFLLN